jgi:hypothetical protein
MALGLHSGDLIMANKGIEAGVLDFLRNPPKEIKELRAPTVSNGKIKTFAIPFLSKDGTNAATRPIQKAMGGNVLYLRRNGSTPCGRWNVTFDKNGQKFTIENMVPGEVIKAPFDSLEIQLAHPTPLVTDPASGVSLAAREVGDFVDGGQGGYGYFVIADKEDAEFKDFVGEDKVTFAPYLLPGMNNGVAVQDDHTDLANQPELYEFDPLGFRKLAILLLNTNNVHGEVLEIIPYFKYLGYWWPDLNQQTNVTLVNGLFLGGAHTSGLFFLEVPRSHYAQKIGLIRGTAVGSVIACVTGVE